MFIAGQVKQLNAVPFAAKFGGATGNLNAHHVAYPEIDWKGFANKFVNDQLGLTRCISVVTCSVQKSCLGMGYSITECKGHKPGRPSPTWCLLQTSLTLRS